MLHLAHAHRLLFHRVRPVFVFDGATPALKRSTHIARRRRREAQEVQLRKTAQKLLLNRLKQHVSGAGCVKGAALWLNMEGFLVERGRGIAQPGKLQLTCARTRCPMGCCSMMHAGRLSNSDPI
jgi:hypothetical protein